MKKTKVKEPNLANIIELNVDFIGGEEPLTEDEKLEISEFIKQRKIMTAKLKVSKKQEIVISNNKYRIR